MCLLFFNINDNCNKDELRLVLANNRDEFWRRPTKTAEFWPANQSCISGLDQEPGREGGTWFGASRHGRIACLVNISQQQDLTKKGRGFLVTDFLTKADSIESYTDSIASERDNYNGFILTLIELGLFLAAMHYNENCERGYLQEEDGSVKMAIYFPKAKKGEYSIRRLKSDPTYDRPTHSKLARVTNDKLTDTPVLLTTPSPNDYFSVGNSPVGFPWRKVEEGEKRFQKIVQTYSAISTRDRLTEELFEMLGDRTRYLPDAQLQKDGQQCRWDQDSIDSKSAMFVWDPKHGYGTRTMTVLTVDGEGKCDYVEKTLQLPVTGGVEALQWSTAHHRFTWQPASTSS